MVYIQFGPLMSILKQEIQSVLDAMVYIQTISEDMEGDDDDDDD